MQYNTSVIPALGRRQENLQPGLLCEYRTVFLTMRPFLEKKQNKTKKNKQINKTETKDKRKAH